MFDPDDHALAVDLRRGEANRFGNPQAGRVTDSQDHAMFQIVHGGEEAGNLVLALHDGKLLPSTHGGDVLLDNPGSPEGHGVEEPERGDRDDDRTGSETFLLGEIDQIGADLSRTE